MQDLNMSTWGWQKEMSDEFSLKHLFMLDMYDEQSGAAAAGAAAAAAPAAPAAGAAAPSPWS